MAAVSSPSTPAGSRLDRLRARVRKPGEASFFFYDAHFKNDAVKILPGEYFVFNEDLLIMTTLGSCIAACLWDRNARIGGMNHFMLPEGNGDSGRYGSYAMELLINEMMKRGASRGSMEAKVFGGGQVISGMSTLNVGAASDPFVAREMIRTLNPDVITLDIEMPRMDGIDFLSKLMRLRPMPVVMVSTLTERGAEVTLRALELGAVDFVAKPKIGVADGLKLLAQDITDKVRIAAKAHLRRLVVSASAGDAPAEVAAR